MPFTSSDRRTLILIVAFLALLLPSCSDDPGECPEGQIMENGTCVTDCPEGTVRIDALCIPAGEEDGDSESSDHEIDRDHAESQPEIEEESAPPDPIENNPYVPILGGFLTLGAEHQDTDEAPPHQVTLSGFEIQKREVTVGEYEICVNQGSCRPNHYVTTAASALCNYGDDTRADMPMNCVDYLGAQAFCRFIGGELPTEAQWEAAARGAEGRIYPWGNEPPPDCARAHMFDPIDGEGCGNGRTAIVGQLPMGATPDTLLDLAGNVSEWVYDWYSQSYAWCSDCSNPTGDPASPQTDRIVHGGSYKDAGENLRASNRIPVSGWDTPLPSDGPYPWIGFRCAREATSEEPALLLP